MASLPSFRGPLGLAGGEAAPQASFSCLVCLLFPLPELVIPQALSKELLHSILHPCRPEPLTITIWCFHFLHWTRPVVYQA